MILRAGALSLLAFAVPALLCSDVNLAGRALLCAVAALVGLVALHYFARWAHARLQLIGGRGAGVRPSYIDVFEPTAAMALVLALGWVYNFDVSSASETAWLSSFFPGFAAALVMVFSPPPFAVARVAAAAPSLQTLTEHRWAMRVTLLSVWSLVLGVAFVTAMRSLASVDRRVLPIWILGCFCCATVPLLAFGVGSRLRASSDAPTDARLQFLMGCVVAFFYWAWKRYGAAN